jgi:glutamate carboxypeptidase
VFDMKAGLVALLWALRNLDDAPARPVRIVLTADEEVGSPSGADVVRTECAGAAAVLALEPPLARGRLKVGRRGVSRVLVSVTGREAHAGLDRAAGVSAIDELVDQLAMIGDRLPESATRSLNVGRVAGGSRANVVAGAAEAELGLRFTTQADEDSIRAVLDALTPSRDGALIAVRTLSHRPAWEPTASRRLAEHVVATAQRLGEDIETAVSGGGGDANLPGSLGVPTVDGLGPRGRGAHAPDESVEVASLLPRARLLRELLTNPLPSHD